MPGLDGPVCLTRSAPFEVSPHQLVFYEVIDVSTSARCSVLSTIAEADGEARLPDDITVSDFKKWITATEDNNEIARQRPFTFLRVVVKVLHV